MSVLYVALPVAVLLGGSALIACIYCIRGGQYDDLDTPAVRILVDEQSSGCETTVDQARETKLANTGRPR